MKRLFACLALLVLVGCATLRPEAEAPAHNNLKLPPLGDAVAVVISYKCSVSDENMLGFTALTETGKFEGPGGAFRRSPEVAATLMGLVKAARENGYAREVVVQTQECPSV